ncbi:ABC transporter permease [Verrucomicrobia bacterium]|nr:ABC transporter permease [Verrucomicrobiota bacterium]
MNQLAATLKLDVRLQARSKLYAIGIVIAVLLGVAGRLLAPPEYAGRILAVFFLTGVGSTTYMIGASLLLQEKSQGTLQALRVTPCSTTTYIASKVITLTSFALVESLIVYAIAFFGLPLNPIPMIFGVVFLGAIYTLVGLGQAAAHTSVTAFLFPGAVLVVGLLQAPIFYVLGGPDPVWQLFPTQGSLLLILGATEALSIWQWIYAFVASIGTIALAFWWAKARFRKFIGLTES